MPLFFRLTHLYRHKNAVQAVMFPVKRRQRLYADRKTPLTPLFSSSTQLWPLKLRLNAVNAFIPTEKRRQRCFFQVHAIKAAVFPIAHR